MRNNATWYLGVLGNKARKRTYPDFAISTLLNSMPESTAFGDVVGDLEGHLCATVEGGEECTHNPCHDLNCYSVDMIGNAAEELFEARRAYTRAYS